ncbi:hypothetical protein IAU59_006873 [Kwoniella sp. CBS 9459]
MDPEAKQKYIEEHAEAIVNVREGPAGLRNLGATCYANAFLQLWFHNVSFRNGVYDCVTSESTKLYHLASIFAMLQYSDRAVVDPSFLIEALRLDKGEQQDAGEFSKLFMNVLEGEFKTHDDPNLRSFMKNQFEGTMQYLTRCDCGYESKTETTFLELEVILKDKATLQECLDKSFALEVLDGENKYHCPSCLQRRDATRRQYPIVYPPVVHISLMRFMYDYQTMTRKKVKACISYPKEIRLGQGDYDLRGVIIHHGTTAHRGHFTCEVWDESERTWLLCNDEEVTPINNRPTKRIKLASSSILNTATTSDSQTSKDAYMLVYKTKNHDVPTRDPPGVVADRVYADNIALENEGAEAATKREAIEDDFAHLNGAKRDSDHIVPRDALAKWLSADTFDALCEPLDMSPILCEHGGVDPDKTDESRLISEEAFDKISLLTSQSSLDICPICVEEGFKLHIADNELQSRIDTFDSLNQGEQNWVIPSVWLDQWKKGGLSPDDSPNSEEYTLYCEHGERSMAPSARSKRRKTITITDEALMLLRSIFGDFKAYRIDDSTCLACLKADEVDVDAREAKQADIAAFKRIKKHVPDPAVAFGLGYYGLPSGFVEEMDDYITGRSPLRPVLRLTCDHGGLDYDPEKDKVLLVTERGWTALCELYGEQEPVILRFGPEHGTGKRRQVVNECKRTCEMCRRARLLDWDTVSVPIIVYQDNNGSDIDKSQATVVARGGAKEKPSFPLMNGFNRLMTPTSRTTGRSTRAAGTFMEFKTDGITKSTSIKELKVQIMRQKRLSPISQRLIYDGRELDRSDETMESIGYLAGDEIRLEEIEEGDEDEIMDGDLNDVMVGGTKRKANGGMEGFGGTALLSRIACPACTFENDGHARECAMCGAGFKSDNGANASIADH